MKTKHTIMFAALAIVAALVTADSEVHLPGMDFTDSQGDKMVVEVLRTMGADTVVIAGGAQSFNPLQAVLEEKGIPCHVTGDAQQVATAFEAVHAGFRAGREI